ncbi:hypothetical protein T492DRAFT_845124 [Pavlovales sp. CCMP2436]|nr:hypothetical protein T492DRAFT_845124 [Pavlovales sp. CCMP2436]
MATELHPSLRVLVCAVVLVQLAWLLAIAWRETVHAGPVRTQRTYVRTPIIPRLVIATAANGGYEAAAYNLASSALFWGADVAWVYDLDGLNAAVLVNGRAHATHALSSSSRKFNEFGWKGIVIRDEQQSTGRAQHNIWTRAQREGHVMFKGQGQSSRKWTSPLAAAALNLSVDILRRHSSYWAGGQAYVKGSDGYTRLLVPLFEASFRLHANLTKHYTHLLAATASKRLISTDPTKQSLRTFWSDRRKLAASTALRASAAATSRWEASSVGAKTWEGKATTYVPSWGG